MNSPSTSGTDTAHQPSDLMSVAVSCVVIGSFPTVQGQRVLPVNLSLVGLSCSSPGKTTRKKNQSSPADTLPPMNSLIATIRSGGQTGVDRGALDAARAAGVPIEGWCPAGGWAEDLPEAPGLRTDYPELRETPSREPAQRTEWNVRDSDVTLIIGPVADMKSGPSPFGVRSECEAVGMGRYNM